MYKKFIFTDFNGVFDAEDSHTISHHDLQTEVEMQTDENKAYMLAKFALDNDALVIGISMVCNHDVDLGMAIYRSLSNSKNEKYQEIAEDFIEILQESMMIYINTESDVDKNDKIIECMKENSEVTCIVFEDQAHIDPKFNLIKTSTYIGLTEEHITQAQILFNK
jgi:hypothetical protein